MVTDYCHIFFVPVVAYTALLLPIVLFDFTVMFLAIETVKSIFN